MKKYIPLMILAFLFLSGCTGENVVQEENQVKENGVASAPVEGNDEAERGIDDMMGLSGAQKCTFSQDGEAMGVIYVDGERMRMDGMSDLMDENETTDQGSMINDGEWVYMWSDTEKQGIKTAIPDEEMMEEDMEANIDEDDGRVSAEEIFEQSQEKNIEYSCEKWAVDESVFIPPADVNFVDMNQMMQQFDPSGSMDGLPSDLPQM